MPDIEIPTQCELCEAHKTELGILKEIEQIVEKNFEMWTGEQQRNLIIAWFEQYKTDERMYYIEKSKQKTTEKIQAFKQKNIKSINNGGQ